MNSKYEAVIGLEVHVHLKTKTKAFCGCSTEFGQEPNSGACPVCLGFPGALPVLNKVAWDYAIKVGLVLNCTVHEFTKFDRKHYFYPDLPKNYQISQYDLPLASAGFLDIDLEGKTKRIRIKRVHLEEDAGKLIHQEDFSLVDYNRAGIPLLEIVSEPDINLPQEAYEYLLSLKSLIQYLGVSDCDMEKGSLRCDANISLRLKGRMRLGVKTELKNMNSFKGVKEALSFEIKRQEAILAKGKTIIQETRLWDAESMETYSMRTKEEAKDYRYFPEPDLPVFTVSENKKEELRKTIPELPRQKMLRLMKDYALSEYDTGIIVADQEFAKVTEERIKKYPENNKKPIANWSIGPILEISAQLNIKPQELEIPGGDGELIALIKLEREGKISHLMAKSVFNQSITSGKPASQIIEEKNLFQISDAESLENIIDEVVGENSRSVDDYKKGKTNALMFLVGQAMKKSQGKANPKVLQEILKRRLKL